jgi:hypothetical protein
MIKHRHGFAKITATIAISILSGGFAEAATAGQTADEVLLEQRVMSEASPLLSPTLSTFGQTSNSMAQGQTFSPVLALKELKTFATLANAKTAKCADVKKVPFGQKYVLTLDAAGQPCKIYDLSFPNFKLLFAKKNVMQVPVQTLTAKDYLNWLDGNFAQIQASSDNYRKTFHPRRAALNSWVSKLKFRRMPEAVPGSRASIRELGLPKSFKVSDLDLGAQFQFDLKTRSQMQELIAQIRALPTFSGVDDLATESMIKVLNRPELMMESVRFDWNELSKAYDVILEGEFLPFSGPVSLINYQTQYKFAVEKIFRSILQSSLLQLSRYIPVPMVSNAVEVLVYDTFQQIELMYSYQMLQLEDTLKMGTQPGGTAIGIDKATSTKAVELLFGQQSDLISAYIMAVAQGQSFDWENFAKLGKTARYSAEKTREISVAKMNSLLVLNKNCQMELVHGYFGTCSKGGNKEAIYSLISNFSVFGRNFGPPMIYRYQRPYETSLRRGGTWLLSVGLRLFGPQISPTVTNQLDSILKSYMLSGLTDEALLRNAMAFQQRAGVPLKGENATVLKWLFVQNLNPFLPKSLDSENRVIAANRQLLQNASTSNLASIQGE